MPKGVIEFSKISESVVQFLMKTVEILRICSAKPAYQFILLLRGLGQLFVVLVISSLDSSAIAQNLPPTQDITPPRQPGLGVPQPVRPQPTEPILPSPPSPEPRPQPEQPGQRIMVRQIEVKGSTVFKPTDFAPIIQPYLGKSQSLEDLQQVADAITKLHLDKGYITTRAILPNQQIVDGVVVITVYEGNISDLEIRGNRGVRAAYIRSRLQQGIKAPLQRQRLEDQLRLLKSDPLFKNVEASLRPGEKLGESVLIVQVSEVSPILASAFVDNDAPISIGAEQFGVSVGYKNITGFGDSIAFEYKRTNDGGGTFYDLSYRIPVNAKNGTLQLRAAPSDTQATESGFRDLGIEGQNSFYEVSFRQPIIRSPRQELALSLGLAYQSGQTFIFKDIGFPFGVGPDPDGVSTTSVITFGQDYTRRDPQGAWSFQSQFNFGTGLFGATRNSAPIPDGQFFSWQGQVQRSQLIGKANLLLLSTSLQLTPNSLLSQQQFTVGGSQSVRGYRKNARFGDNGVRFSVEGRIPLQYDEAGRAAAQLAPFFDAGYVWNQVGNPNPLPDQRFIAGLGLGVLWNPIPRFNLRLDYGYPLVKLKDRGGNIQDAGFYFRANYTY
jgi:hemolysin activation/secretion protein